MRTRLRIGQIILVKLMRLVSDMGRLKFCIIAILGLAFSVNAVAQSKILVTGFELATGPGSLDANIAGGIRHDINGRQCALIKIETTQTGFTYDFGAAARAEDSVQKVAEIWVWVSPGVKFLTLSHPQLGKSDRYTFPIPIESAKTYIMKLTTAEVQTTIKEVVSQQYLVFSLSPAGVNAALFVNDEFWPLENGTASKYVDFGEYSWRIEADDYYTEAGVAIVNDPSKRTEIGVNLSPSFGYLSIAADADSRDANAYIDNRMIGKLPIENYKLDGGRHSLRIIKRYYDNHEETITIEDGKTLSISPKLHNNAAMLTLMVDNDAEIYANGNLLARGEWRGVLEPGRYRFETRKESHRTQDLVREVVKNANDTIHLPAPVAIQGSLMVDTKPIGVTVKLDGEEIGTSPLRANVLVGKHILALSKEGYQSALDSIEVVEGQTLRLEYEFKPVVNDRNAGNASPKVEMVSAKRVKEDLIRPNSLYAGATVANCSERYLMAVGGMVGATWSNINVEATYLYGWNTTYINWYDVSGTNSDIRPVQSVDYGIDFFSGRVGYQLKVGRSFSITPQVGLNHILLSALDRKGQVGDGANSTSALGAVRVFIALNRWLGIFATPEYSFIVHETKSFPLIVGANKFGTPADPWYDTLYFLRSGFRLNLGIAIVL